ncbi:MAG: glycoside hydrolase family 16 protein [Clostridia bacterium]|nr:glycoside hydrolase family 16 protein [Clostridia bacterium]
MRKYLPYILCMSLVGCSAVSTETSVPINVVTSTASASDTASSTETIDITDSAIESDSVSSESTSESIEETTEKTSYTGSLEYELVWSDEFDGDSLNPDNWVYEEHDSGWVNNELQTYVSSADNIFVENGDLVIQPLKETDENGNDIYTSGRINTYQKASFLYGKVEARIKVPTGQGYLPAFWMMPKLATHYGNWPKSGEIDIMEILGSDTSTTYGTIHYGNSHKQNQGSLTLDSDTQDFAEDYHIFTLEWEPGKITWYVDNIEMYTTDDWYCKSEGGLLTAYPAPFDQEFYIILNVAVGGNWPGSPDDTTPFDSDAQMRVDYVRVYQRPWYDTDVTAPVDYDGVVG